MRVSFQVYLGLSLLAALAIIQEIQAVEYAISNHAERTPGGLIFETKLKQNAVTMLTFATKHIWKLFRQSDSSKNRVQVKKIYLVIDQMDKNSTSELKNQIGRIYISADYIKNSSFKRSDFLDLIYYELIHILLWTAEDHIPVALKDGIAAYIVLDHGTGTPRGVVEFGEGNEWNESPYVTARFLQFCTHVLCPNFVPELNEKMKESASYDEKYFVDLTQKNISEAWKQYKDKYKPRRW